MCVGLRSVSWLPANGKPNKQYSQNRGKQWAIEGVVSKIWVCKVSWWATRTLQRMFFLDLVLHSSLNIDTNIYFITVLNIFAAVLLYTEQAECAWSGSGDRSGGGGISLDKHTSLNYWMLLKKNPTTAYIGAIITAWILTVFN